MTIKKMFTVACLTAGLAHSANAQAGRVFSSSEDAPGSYVAGIWVDPDGCQHWVMDLGIEGMMDSVLTRDGQPVCGGGVSQSLAAPATPRAARAVAPATTSASSNSCGGLSGDVSFPEGSAQLSVRGYQEAQALATQLKSSGVNSVSVVGYTDSIGNPAANEQLSAARAQAVASVLGTAGLSVLGATGRGASNPIADNSTPAGRAQNRRVELICQ